MSAVTLPSWMLLLVLSIRMLTSKRCSGAKIRNRQFVRRIGLPDDADYFDGDRRYFAMTSHRQVARKRHSRVGGVRLWAFDRAAY